MAKNKTRYIGWGYVKEVIREYALIDYPICRLKTPEIDAVNKAVDSLNRLPDGTERKQLIDLVFWKKSHTLHGAALKCYISYETAQKWHSEFIEAVGKNMGVF